MKKEMYIKPFCEVIVLSHVGKVMGFDDDFASYKTDDAFARGYEFEEEQSEDNLDFHFGLTPYDGFPLWDDDK